MAAIILETVIKANPIGRWYLEIRDSEEDRTEICLDLDEYAQKIEDMGAIYGGDVEVAWSSEENVTQIQINEVRQAMIMYEQKLQEEQANQNNPDDGGFNPNG